jgi:hypothetical protein
MSVEASGARVPAFEMAKTRKEGALKSAPARRSRPAKAAQRPRSTTKTKSTPRTSAKGLPRTAASALPRTTVPLPEITAPIDFERPLTPDELSMERDRIYARMVSIQNVISRPSPADFVVFEVGDPQLVHRRLVAAGIPADTVQKYPKIPNGMRVMVRSAKRNEAFLRALEVAVK